MRIKTAGRKRKPTMKTRKPDVGVYLWGKREPPMNAEEDDSFSSSPR
jgi:hypothetical protein